MKDIFGNNIQVERVSESFLDPYPKTDTIFVGVKVKRGDYIYYATAYTDFHRFWMIEKCSKDDAINIGKRNYVK